MNNIGLINCSNCQTALRVPPGATSILCAICRAVTCVSNNRALAPAAAPPPMSVAPPNAHGRKRAVICGISYKNSRHELKGCINDAKCMRYLLANKFGFPEDSILMLTEEETDPYRIPTKHNIKMAFYWLVQGCQAGDSLLFHYSGHGAQQRNYSGEEADGYDETLCPLDFETQGMIVDDEVNAMIVRPLPHGVKLHSIIDACHSGTVLDLPFLCRMNRDGQYMWEDHRPRSGVWKGTSGGEAISFSGCDDNQTSADTSALSKITSTGAMTFCFIQAIENGQSDTYGDILNSMRNAIRKVGKDNNNNNNNNNNNKAISAASSLVNVLTSSNKASSLVKMVMSSGNLGLGGGGGRLTQVPQLTSCQPFDVYAKPFSL